MSNISIFNFKSAHPVRIQIDEYQKIWFCVIDICRILGYTNSNKTLKDHCFAKGVTKRYTLTEGGKQELMFISEGNLYRLIIKSRKEEARDFEAWVCDEVLPTIRKTGSYHTQPQATSQLKTLTVDEIHAKVEAICKNFSIEPDTAMMQLYIHMYSTLGLKHSMNINNIQKDLGNPSPEHLAYFTVLLDKLEKHALKMRQVCENTEMEFICRFINPYESRKHINPNHIPEWFRNMTLCGKRPQEMMFGNWY